MNIKAFIVALAAASFATASFAGDPTNVGTDDNDLVIPVVPGDAGSSAVSSGGSSAPLAGLLGGGAAGAAATLGLGALGLAGLVAILDSSDTTTPLPGS